MLTRPAKITAAGLLASLAALALYAKLLPVPEEVPRPVDKARFTTEEEKKVRAELRDPDSTTFRNTKVSLMHRAPVLCGEMNTKNETGGYAGFQRFVSGGAVRAYERDIGRIDMDRLWRALCDEHHPVRDTSP